MRSFTGKRWIVPEKIYHPQRVAQDIVSIRDLREGEVFDPSSLHDIGKAVERIRRAMKRKECIGIFGDYDCDGVTAVAQLVRFFRRSGCDPTVRLPHRIHDGYGLKQRHIKELSVAGSTLLITVDTGITAHIPVDIAHARGMDVIIVDHHEIRGGLPRATAILHPAFATPPLSPSPCAAGLVSLLLATLEGNNTRPEQAEDRAIAAIGTVADLVELRSGNRTMVQDGLRAIAALPDGPLRSLIECSRSSDTAITGRDIAFRIAPRLNAAGRMDDPMIALRALLDGGDALHTLEELNASRQSLVEELFTYLLASLPPPPALPPLLSIADEKFPPGVVGLLAGKLTERFSRPSMVASIIGAVCTASLRSIPAVHITELLSRSAHLLTSFGGHAQAAGCTFPREHFEELTMALQADVARNVPPEDLVSAITIDAVLPLSTITLDLCESLETLEPFGQGNPEPRFLLPNVQLEKPRLVGSTAKHLAASLGPLHTIGFGLSHLLPHLSQPVDIVCRLGINEWNGYRTPQIFMEDARPAITVPSPTLNISHKEKQRITQ